MGRQKKRGKMFVVLWARLVLVQHQSGKPHILLERGPFKERVMQIFPRLEKKVPKRFFEALVKKF